MKSGVKARACAHWTGCGCLRVWVLLVGVGKAWPTLWQGGKGRWRMELVQCVCVSSVGCKGDRWSVAFPSSPGATADKHRGQPEAAEPQAAVRLVPRLPAVLPADGRGQALVSPGTAAGKRPRGCRVCLLSAARGSWSAQVQGVRWAPFLRICSLGTFPWQTEENPGLGWVGRRLSRSPRP